jgi:hypothetical protein
MRRVLPIVAIVLAGLGALALRVVLEGQRALEHGDAAAAHGDVREAIASWESCARWYLPGAPHVDAAYDRLIGLAAADPPHALAAWRAVRSAAIATTSLWPPHPADLAAANAAIASLSADDPSGAKALGPERAARLAWHQTLLGRPARPAPALAALAIAGIAGWLVGIGLLVGRGVDDAGRLVRRPAAIAAALIVAGVVAWALGLYGA